MQNNEQSLLCHRENYTVPKGQERSVHCKIAKLDSNGNLLEKAKIVRFGVKSFETYDKNNLETMGYTVEILYHPMGRYSNVTITDKDATIREKDKEIEALKAELASKESNDEKDKEIARLRAELARAKEGETKKGGRPKKED